jgi:diguanylate cyclase (GGDEF)-like protein
MRILVVEDDEFIANALKLVLSEQNYAVEAAEDGEAGWELVQAYEYDLILLDVMLPKLNGIDLCRRIRSQGYKMPILLLTGRDSSHDKAIGLDAGADDYLVKPFDQEELFARVRALLRRGSTSVSPVLEWGELRLDPSSCEVTYGTRSLQLTPKEYALLELFLRNNRRVFSCSAILDHVWSFDKTPGEEAVRTQIKGLRQKLKAAGAPTDLIETVYGIGYRLKPQTFKLAPKTEEPSERTRQQTLAALAGVWERFQGRVNEQIMLLEQVASALLPAQPTPEQRQQAEQVAHTLAGSLGTFGFGEGSQLARKIERILRTNKPLSPKEAKHLQKLVAALRQAIELTPSELVTEPTAAKQETPRLLIFQSDRHLAEPILKEAHVWGIQAEVVTELETAKKAIASCHPQVLLLDLDGNTADGLALLVELKHRQPPLPVLVHSGQDNLMTRLEVARSGGQAFLPKPVSSAQVLQAVTQLLPERETVAAKVMAVDDDPQILAALRSLLEPWGLRTICIDDPRHFWETLEASAPDLLILDINMPDISGLELCQIVRQDSHWSGLPILFLTAYSDANTVNQVFAVGADDFVSKPIVGPELVNRIMNRLDRIELLRSLAEIDPLTGVANRHKSAQDLDRLLRLAKRHHQPLCLAILDIDRFKQVNDTCGHAAGDLVLRQLGQWLLQSLRGEDVVARWGGEEFVLGLYGMTIQDGVQRLTDILKGWLQQRSKVPECSQIPVTFSAGIAQFPEHGADVESLYRAADTALYRAKSDGRGRIVPAGEDKETRGQGDNSIQNSKFKIQNSQ